MDEKKCCTVVNHYYGCCGGNGSSNGGNGSDSTPVGTVISYMGTSAPKNYLTCDGIIYNIDDYKDFSQFIKDQFGSYNYFGGDGTTTFAVPDLRNEFLRGYHGDKEEKISGDIGVHQDATNHVGFDSYNGAQQLLQSRGLSSTKTFSQSNVDSRIIGTNWRNYAQSSTGNDTGGTSTYTSRPTNVAVLYCIKYK